MSLSLEDYVDDEGSSVVIHPTTYPNGYSYRRALRIGGSAITGPSALTDLPLRFDETFASLKSASSGGHVQSTAGWDIRFEDTSGTQLKHELETYDPVAGRAACWVRIPSANPGFDQELFVYYGKSGLTGPEQDVSATGTWARCLGCWRMPDGRDVTGHGRDMTTSGVTSGAIGAHPAAVLTSSSYLELLDTSFMDAKSAFTPFLLVQPSSLPSGNADFVRFGGTAAGTGKLGFTHYDQPDVAKALRNYDWLGASTAFLIGPANSAVAGHTYTWALPVTSGAWPVQEFDGAPVTSAQRGAFGTGVTSYPATVLLRIGAGYGDNTTCVPGAYGRFWVFDSLVPDGYIAFLDLTIRFPRACYGIGDEDSPLDTDRSPVLAPAFAAAAVGGSVDVNILAHASDPDGNPLATGLASPGPAFGTASIVANLVHYARASAGVDRFGITATAGAKTARALLTVATGTVIQPDGDMPLAPKAGRITAWELVKSSAGIASIVEGADVDTGVRLNAGRVTANIPANAIGLVSVKALVAGGSAGMVVAPITVSYEYRRASADPAVPNADGIFSQIGFYRRAAGANANLASLGTQAASGEWTADYSPTDAFWSSIPAGATKSVARGLRFSFDRHSLSGAGDNLIALRSIHDDGTISGTLATSANTFDFTNVGVWARLDWSIPGAGDSTVTVTATWASGSTTTEVFDHPEIATFFAAGTAFNVILLCYSNREAVFRHADIQSALTGGGVLADYVGANTVRGRGDPARRDVASRSDLPASLVPNVQYTVVNDISFGAAANRDAASNTITLAGGLKGSTMYLRGHTEGGAPSTWPLLSNGTINITAQSLIIRGFRLRNMRFVIMAGAKLVQIESNYISDFYEGYDTGIVVSKGTDACDRILIAFNRYSDDVATISGPLLRVHSAGKVGSGPAPCNHVTMYRNHINGLETGPSVNVSGGNSGISRVIFVGDGFDDANWDMGLLVKENLCTDWRTKGPFAETKFAGVTFQGNTFEWGATSSVNKDGVTITSNTPLQVRIRQGRATTDPTTDIDRGVGAIVDGNLWIEGAGSSYAGSGINVRDGFTTVTNNWVVALAGGTQPAATSTPVSAQGKFRVELFRGNLDWTGFPANQAMQPKGIRFCNAGKAKVGGNHCFVLVGMTSGVGHDLFDPDRCRVGGQGGSSPDRNLLVTRTAESNPDSGTVVGADYDGKIPTRLRGGTDNGFGIDEFDVGPAAWDPSYYGRQD